MSDPSKALSKESRSERKDGETIQETALTSPLNIAPFEVWSNILMQCGESMTQELHSKSTSLKLSSEVWQSWRSVSRDFRDCISDNFNPPIPIPVANISDIDFSCFSALSNHITFTPPYRSSEPTLTLEPFKTIENVGKKIRRVALAKELLDEMAKERESLLRQQETQASTKSHITRIGNFIGELKPEILEYACICPFDANGNVLKMLESALGAMEYSEAVLTIYPGGMFYTIGKPSHVTITNDTFSPGFLYRLLEDGLAHQAKREAIRDASQSPNPRESWADGRLTEPLKSVASNLFSKSPWLQSIKFPNNPRVHRPSDTEMESNGDEGTIKGHVDGARVNAR